MASLAQSFDVIAPEHPGFGNAAKPAWLDGVPDMANFYLDMIDEKNPMTWGDHDINKVAMKNVFAAHKLSENTIDFLGHAVALHRDDSYLEQPASDTIRKMNL